MEQTRSRRGASRRLARHVLIPLFGGGLVLVAALVATATLLVHSAALHELDARANAYRAGAATALAHDGHLGPAIAAARADGVGMSAVSADRPLPGGEAIRQRGVLRTYTLPVRDRRVAITLNASRVDRATKRALVISSAIGALLLVLLCALVGTRLRRAATAPLGRLRSAIERIVVGQAADVAGIGGAAEVRALSKRLGAVSATLADLEAQAATDPLTGVANRRAFQRTLDAELRRADREARPMTLVLLDLDGFKEINDTHGHPFGDGVLQVIADKVKGVLRATDTVARVGGDEFAIVLPGMPRDDATSLVERAREQAAKAIGGVQLTWCAGIATFPTDARESETLVECADAALYCAKNTGASAICHYDPHQAQAPHPSGDRGLVQDLLSKSDAVVPVFQPLISMQTGQVAGYEALARFPHPPARRPDEWFAIAARCGLGPQLEARAIEAALASAGRPAGTFLSFNLSASALMSDLVIAALPDDLSDIVIEITENERVADDEKLAARLEPLRRRGARIAVDDAGAGYSGLQQVMRVQPDIMKLDRSLVADVDRDPAKAALIDSFVRFASRTGAQVCAEGIETAEELRVLCDLEVSYGQGFGVARPAAPWASVEPWVPAQLAAAIASQAASLIALPGGDAADLG